MLPFRVVFCNSRCSLCASFYILKLQNCAKLSSLNFLIHLFMCLLQVYQQSISASCQLDWPKDRLLIQVLDDSDDETIQLLIKGEVSQWSQRGINIVYRHRLVRTGYKAGNLKSAMSCDYVKNYEFVAIFDADFQPNPDFLKLTVPHFKVNVD